MQGNIQEEKKLVGRLSTGGSLIGGVGDFKGDSAYEVAVKNGFEGTEEEWLKSLKGEAGVYVGSGDMPEDCFVQIDPEGEPFDCFPKLSQDNPNGIVGTNVVIGSPYGDGSLYDSGVNVFNVVTKDAFQKHDNEIVFVEPCGVAGQEENWEYQIKPSGININDVQQKFDTNNFITSATIEETVKAIKIDFPDKPIYKEFFIKLEVPADSSGANTAVTLRTSIDASSYFGYMRNGIAATKSFSWYHGFWRGAGWEGNCCQAQNNSVSTVYSMPYYPANGVSPMTGIALCSSGTTEVNYFRAGTKINIYGW